MSSRFGASATTAAHSGDAEAALGARRSSNQSSTTASKDGGEPSGRGARGLGPTAEPRDFGDQRQVPLPPTALELFSAHAFLSLQEHDPTLSTGHQLSTAGIGVAPGVRA